MNMRGFSDEERDQIREELIQTGQELLIRYGPSKTTVKDITDPVGIAKPTFYRFFESKSELYLIIIQQELETYMEDLHSELDGIEDPREQLERFFRCYVRFAEENEFVQQLFIEGNHREMVGNLSSEQIAEIERKEMEILIPHVEAIQEQSDGIISEMNPLTVLGIMGSSLGLQVLHQDEYDEYAADLDEIDEGFYTQIQETLITVLARGLTSNE